MKKNEVTRSARHLLLAFLKRNGNVHSPDLKLRKKIGSDKYKKGWEIRFAAKSRKELYLIRRLLDEVGLKKGKPFRKGTLFIQPLYGKEAVAWFKPQRQVKK